MHPWRSGPAPGRTCMGR